MKKEFKLAFKLTLPVLFGYLALGIAFGLLMADKHYPIWLTAIMGTFMFAGAGQYIAAGLFAAGTPLIAIVITEALVNIRHIVYGLSLITKFSNTGRWKPYLIFALSDETYAIEAAMLIPEDMNRTRLFASISILDQFYWISGTLIGHMAGIILQNTTGISLQGVDFALTALFAVLLVEQIMNSKDFVPPAIGTACTIGGIILFKTGIIPDASSILLISLSAGVALIALLRHPAGESGTKDDMKANPVNNIEED